VAKERAGRGEARKEERTRKKVKNGVLVFISQATHDVVCCILISSLGIKSYQELYVENCLEIIEWFYEATVSATAAVSRDENHFRRKFQFPWNTRHGNGRNLYVM